MSNTNPNPLVPPATPATLAEHAQAILAAQQAAVAQNQQVFDAAAGDAKFTAEDLQKARSEEKDKVYSDLNKEKEARTALQKQVEGLLAAQKEREDAEAAARAAAEATAKATAEAELSAKELLEKREAEFNQKMADQQAQFQQKFQEFETTAAQQQAILEKERQMASLSAFVQQRLGEEGDSIAPQLRDFVTGNNPDEINASIETVKAKSVEIAEAARAAFNSQRSMQVGASPTGYTAGLPTDGAGERQLSAQDIANMSMAEYQKHRSQLIGTSAANRGLYS